MQALPHRYRAAAHLAADSHVVRLSAAGLPELESAGPVEFDGPGDRWSPETLLPALVGDCFLLTFDAIAAASRFAWKDLNCEVEAVVDKVDKVLKFAAFRLQAVLTVDTATDEDRARRILEKAERGCLVRNSLAAPVHSEFRIVRA